MLADELGERGLATMVIVHGRDHASARALATSLGAALPDARALSWLDDSPFLANSVRASATLGVVSESMVVVAVAVPVCALLYLHVLHRRRQIALLAALGFRAGELFVMCLLQALFVGLAGVAAGAVIAIAVVAWFRAHPIFDGSGFLIRPVLSVACFARPALAVLVTTLAASAWPAWRAASIDPTRVLRELE
jgi:ABC-type lipoprotein release transport system permease subunit